MKRTRNKWTEKCQEKWLRANEQLQERSEEERTRILWNVAFILAFTIGVALAAIYSNNYLIVLIIIAIWIT